MGRKLKIAAIIPTYRRDKYLIQTLEYLLNQTRVPDEILVIDQTAPSEQDHNSRLILGELEKKGPIKIYFLEEPAVSKARNFAIMAAKSDILLYLDDDIIPSNNLVENHYRHYLDDNVYGIAGSVASSLTQEYFVTPPGYYKNRSIIWKAYHFNLMFDEPERNVSFMCYNNCSMRKESLIKVGGFDENILNYGEDIGIRMAQAGNRIDYDPEAKIVHIAAPSGGTRVSDPKNRLKGYQRYLSIHYLAFRYLNKHPFLFLKHGLWQAARFSFLLKYNFLRPWTWPNEIFGYFYSLILGYKLSTKGMQSPFINSHH
jgi:GT2 family glycosyltransferase